MKNYYNKKNVDLWKHHGTTCLQFLKQYCQAQISNRLTVLVKTWDRWHLFLFFDEN